MDIAHKEYLEKLTKEKLINRNLDQEENEKKRLEEILVLNTRLVELEKTNCILLNVIKYQNHLGDNQ